MTEAAPDAVVDREGELRHPQGESGDTVSYSGTPELMAAFACLALDAGARIVGGCCGTSAAHLAVMRHALEGHRRGERPDLEKIVAALGPLVSPPARTDAGAPRQPTPGGGLGAVGQFRPALRLTTKSTYPN